MGKSYDKNKNSLQNLQKFVKSEEEKTLAVFKESIKDLIEEANKTIYEGGHMRVDTGFLRASGVAAINEVPKGENEGRKRAVGETGVLYSYNTASVNVMLPKLKFKDKFYFGWTAWYAQVREAYDGFLATAIQKWPQIIDKNIRRVSK